MSDLSALKERLEKASGPDRELDAEICAAFRYYAAPEPEWVVNWVGEWRAVGRLVHLLGPQGSRGNFIPEPLTASIDAALGLVERKRAEIGETARWSYRVFCEACDACWENVRDPRDWVKLLANFICIALVSALIAQEQEEANASV